MAAVVQMRSVDNGSRCCTDWFNSHHKGNVSRSQNVNGTSSSINVKNSKGGKKILCTQWSFFMLLFWDTSNWYWRGCFKLISFPFDRHERTLWIIFCGAIHVKELSDHPHENISLNSQFYSIFFQVGGPIGIIFYFIVYYTCILHEPPYPVRGMMVTVDSFFGHSKWPLRISKTRKRELHSIGLLFFH